jgi:hypothetical protein
LGFLQDGSNLKAPRQHSKKRKRRDSLVYEDDNVSQDSPQKEEIFEKRQRHKTKADRYDTVKVLKQLVEEEKIVRKKVKKAKRGDIAKAAKKAGEDLMRSFTSKNIGQARLTVSFLWESFCYSQI